MKGFLERSRGKIMETYINSRQYILNKLAEAMRIRARGGKGIAYNEAIHALTYTLVEIMREQCETPLDRMITGEIIKEIEDIIISNY